MSRTSCCCHPIEGLTIWHYEWCDEARATRQRRLALLVLLLFTILIVVSIGGGDFWDTEGWIP